MLDNLRNDSSFKPDEEENQDLLQAPKTKPQKTRRSIDQITGTTAKQRFFLALMLLIMVCLLGVVMLLVTGKIVLPM